MGREYLGNILISLQQTSIPSLISALELSPNPKIREICGDLTDRIFQIGKTLTMDELWSFAYIFNNAAEGGQD